MALVGRTITPTASQSAQTHKKEERKIKKAFEKCYERYGWYGVYEELIRKGYKRSFSGMVYAAKRMGLKKERAKKPPRKQARRYPELLMPGEKVQIDVKEVPYNCLRGDALKYGRRFYQWTAIDEYVYDEYFNCVICPENQVLSYAATNREGYREFKSKGYVCESCPSRHLCTENQKFEKTVTKHIWSEYLETVEDIRHTPEYKALYERRKETIERVFADAKEKYAMRYTPYRGLSQVTNWVRLKFAAMNLKNMHCIGGK